ncbi:hypothetical protein Mapa_000933 [Marchantia paleacea]|nr:hypothetical protein Mapa_000933 [Marchantia paleacea]
MFLVLTAVSQWRKDTDLAALHPCRAPWISINGLSSPLALTCLRRSDEAHHRQFCQAVGFFRLPERARALRLVQIT